MGLFSRLLFEQVQSTRKQLLSQHHLKSQERMKVSIIATTMALAALVLPGSEALPKGAKECHDITQMFSSSLYACGPNGYGTKGCIPALAESIEFGLKSAIRVCLGNMNHKVLAKIGMDGNNPDDVALVRDALVFANMVAQYASLE